MKKLHVLVVAAVSAAAVAASGCATAPAKPSPAPAQPIASPSPAATLVAPPTPSPTGPPSPPVARRQPHATTMFGHRLSDDYFWLRHKDAPEVVDYLNAENRYSEAMLAPTKPLQQKLYDEMLSRIKQTDVTVPYRDNGYFYYTRVVEGQQYGVVCRKSAQGAAADDTTGKTATAPEEVLLDLNQIAQTHRFVSVGAEEISDDNTTMAYALDVTGFRQYSLAFKDLTGRRSFAESIPRVTSVTFAADNKTVFYVTEDATSKRSDHLYRHVLGSDPAGDELIYDEKDERFDISVGRTRSRKLIVLHAESKTTSEERFVAADHPRDALRVLAAREHDVRYFAADHNGEFFIRTDAPVKAGAPKARNFRLVTAPIKTPDRAHWRELVAHDDQVMLENVDVFSDRVVLHERVDALPRLVILPLGKKGKPETIPMPEPIYVTFADANAEWDTPVYRFHYQSPVTPDSVFEWSARTHQLTLLKRQEVPGFDGSLYTTQRVHAVAADGTEVPISLVYRKDLPPGVPHPMLLYGYGSYGISMPMTFSTSVFSLLDRGMVYAIAHIRGGGDLGTRWHEEGRMATKMNTFTDFIACAEALIADGWTRSDELAIQGGSAGGLLMGAVTNLRPDLFKVVVAQVPFVDVINTMLDESLPLTVGEFEEWGNPKKEPEFDVMIKYSPYDNVVPQAYPSLLVMTSYNDSQVMYWEPAKWVARLRANKIDHNPLLLHINMEPAGHGGPSGRYNHLRETALVDAFVLTQLGLGN